MTRGFGYIADPRDDRDRVLGVMRSAAVPRAQVSRLYLLITHIRDQLSTSSCVGQSVAAWVELRRILDGLPPVVLSALAVYWAARAIGDQLGDDGGTFIRNGARVAHKIGVASEKAWPFRVDRVQERPHVAADVDGVTRSKGSYQRITQTGAARVEAVLDALQARCPVVLGMQVTQAFCDHVGGETLAAPSAGESAVGGHAVLIAGFDRSGERVRLINSWGIGFGDYGQAWLASEWLALPTTQDVWVALPRSSDGT